MTFKGQYEREYLCFVLFIDMQEIDNRYFILILKE